MIHIGTRQVSDLHHGTRRVASIHLGTHPIYGGSAPSGDPVLFDAGYVEGIAWSANLLTRPNYTTYAAADLSTVPSGYMRLRITGGGASTSYNAHVCTTNKVTIPATAAKLFVRVKNGDGSGQRIMKFGLLGDDYVNSCSGEGGVMSAAQYVSSATETDYSINLPAGFAGTSDYRAVVNIQDNGGSARDFRVTKVWFE